MTNQQILTPLQLALLNEFFAAEFGRSFFLTGGTALAAFYFQHRLSNDIDLFTTDGEAFRQVPIAMPEIAARLGVPLVRGGSGPAFDRYFLGDEKAQIDLVRDQDVQFGEKREFGRVIVDAPENIGANKITAIFGRTESKDFVDLYFLLSSGQDWDHLLTLAKEKDLGLNNFYLAGMMRQVETLKSLPIMLKPITLETLKAFYLDLATDLVRDIKPE